MKEANKGRSGQTSVNLSRVIFFEGRRVGGSITEHIACANVIPPKKSHLACLWLILRPVKHICAHTMCSKTPANYMTYIVVVLFTFTVKLTTVLFHLLFSVYAKGYKEVQLYVWVGKCITARSRQHYYMCYSTSIGIWSFSRRLHK